MLAYSAFLDINDGLILDKILCEGDSLYMNIVSKLKNYGKFIQPLLSLDEIPDEIEIEKGKFIVNKQPIVSGIRVYSFDVDHGLPSLHCVLQSAFASVSSGLLIIGAICSAEVKKDHLYKVITLSVRPASCPVHISYCLRQESQIWCVDASWDS